MAGRPTPVLGVMVRFFPKSSAEPRTKSEDTSAESREAPSTSPNWADFWLAAQRKNWEHWIELSRQAFGTRTEATATGDDKAPADLWSRLLDLWSSFWTPLIPGQPRELMARMLEANKAYFRMGEGLWKVLSASYGAAQGTENPWDALSQGIRQMHEQFGEQIRNAKDPWSGFATFWGMPLDNWRRVCSAFSIMPGDMEKPRAALARLMARKPCTRAWLACYPCRP